MAGGAAITVITKSGTNEFKGSAFEFYNNENLNAKPYFATEKTDASSHIDGATLGGPIMKNKLFFFGVVGRAVSEDAVSSSSTTCRPRRCASATSARRSTATAPAGHLRPVNGQSGRDGTHAVPGQPDPGEQSTGIAQKIQDAVSRSEPRRDAGQRRWRGHLAQLRADAGPKFDRNNYDFKVNYNLSAANQIWGKYSRMGADVIRRRRTSGTTGADRRHDGATCTRSATTWTLSPTMVFDATCGISKMNHESTARDFGLGNFGLDMLGYPGHERRRELQQRSALRRHAVLPDRLLVQLRLIGNDDGWDPVQRDERTYAFSTNMTKLRGSSRVPRSATREPAAHEPLAARARIRSARVHCNSRRTRPRSNGGAQTANIYNAVRRVPAGPGGLRGARACRTS